MGMLKKRHQALAELMNERLSHLFDGYDTCSCENAQYYQEKRQLPLRSSNLSTLCGHLSAS